jgi:hypothetical protein
MSDSASNFCSSRRVCLYLTSTSGQSARKVHRPRSQWRFRELHQSNDACAPFTLSAPHQHHAIGANHATVHLNSPRHAFSTASRFHAAVFAPPHQHGGRKHSKRSGKPRILQNPHTRPLLTHICSYGYSITSCLRRRRARHRGSRSSRRKSSS